MEVVQRLLPIFIIMVSGFLVAVADGLIKHVSLHSSNLWNVLRSPFMIPISAIYLFAILAFSFAFIKRWDLGVVGLMQIVIYAVAVVLYGVLFFQERLTFVHGVGMVLAVVATMLMNL